MAPEVARLIPYNNKADVYSFGMILWELFTSQKPFENIWGVDYYEKVVYGGLRPEISKKFPNNDLAKIIRECWDVDPQKRPTFQSVSLLGNEISKTDKDRSRKVSRDRTHKIFPKQPAAAA